MKNVNGKNKAEIKGMVRLVQKFSIFSCMVYIKYLYRDVHCAKK